MRHFYSALLTNHAGRHKDYSKRPTNVLIAYRVLIVLGGEIWRSFLSTHAFLLGNGQTYATRGVPYYRVSRIFMSRNFHPCKLVPQIHVSHFPPLQHGAAFSCPAISCLAFSASPVYSKAISQSNKNRQSSTLCGSDIPELVTINLNISALEA